MPPMNASFSTGFISSDTTRPVWLTHSGITGQPADTVTDAISPITAPPSRFFSGQAVKLPFREPMQKTEPQNDWLYGSFALILLIIVVLRLTWYRQITQMFRSMLFPSKGASDTRVFDFRINSFTVLFAIIYCMTFSLMILGIVERLGPRVGIGLEKEFIPFLFFLVAGGFLLLLLIKLAMAWFVARVFQVREAGQAYRDHLLLSAFSSAAVIIPIIVVNAFSTSPAFLIVAALFMITLILIRLFRTVVAGSHITPFSYLHIFLYFCTLEIIPLLVIGKGVHVYLAL
jgi:hypothetical protein